MGKGGSRRRQWFFFVLTWYGTHDKNQKISSNCAFFFVCFLASLSIKAFIKKRFFEEGLPDFFLNRGLAVFKRC